MIVYLDIFIFIYLFSVYFSRIPLLGEFTAQNAIMAERFIEAGSPYVSKCIDVCITVY